MDQPQNTPQQAVPNPAPQATPQPKFKFPTEIVELHSKGLVYPSTSPFSSGKVEMKYMTAREEIYLNKPKEMILQMHKLSLIHISEPTRPY